MRWTSDQKGAEVLREHFGDPPRRNTQAFDVWAEVVADYIEENPPPLPIYGEEYLLDNGSGGSKVGTYIGPVPDRPEVWVFQMVETLSGTDSSARFFSYEEHGRATILDHYASWLAEQSDEEQDEEQDDAPELWVGPPEEGWQDMPVVTLEGYAGPNTDALATAEHQALEGPPPPPEPLGVEQGGEQ